MLLTGAPGFSLDVRRVPRRMAPWRSGIPGQELDVASVERLRLLREVCHECRGSGAACGQLALLAMDARPMVAARELPALGHQPVRDRSTTPLPHAAPRPLQASVPLARRSARWAPGIRQDRSGTERIVLLSPAALRRSVGRQQSDAAVRASEIVMKARSPWWSP
jgi:hypothetical protein